MFKIGSYVMYENEGVCRVMDITPYPYGNQEKGQKLYYQLSPLFKKGATIYVSVHTNAQIRDIMTAKEARFFMEHLAGIKPDILRSRKPAQLTEHYRKMLLTYQPEILLSLMKEGYVKKTEAEEQKKKPGQIDLQYLKSAEALVCAELAVALNSTVETIKEYLESRIRKEIREYKSNE
ncbi:MAG TPA: CarD family transcriptional regulator [Candidatus Fimimorpha excrementavium]|nr:CarD family transcriptional regulator [Candidatus Fimimorpha excrementavium]